MAGTLVQYAYTEGADIDQELLLQALDPVHQARAILEQVVYREYILRSVRNITVCLQDYCDHVVEMVRMLPETRNDLDGPQSALYHSCVNAIKQFPYATAATYDSLLCAPSTSLYWKPTIPRQFYLPFLSLIGSGHLPDEKEMPNAFLLVPTIVTYHRAVVDHSAPPQSGMRIRFQIINLQSFRYTQAQKTYRCTEEFLGAFLKNASFPDWTMDHFIGLLSGFCVEPGHHAMKDHRQYSRGVADICYEILHPSRHKKQTVDNHPSIERGTVQGIHYILDMLKTLVADNRIGDPEDTSVFSEFLAKSGQYPQELVNYFAKPVNEITATEAYAYRSSELSSFMPDRFKAGLESSTSETGGSSDDATLPDGVDTSDPSTEDNDSFGNIDPQGGDDSSTLSTDTLPKRNPLLLLLELATPDERLSDYLYRRLVMERIAAIVANPPLGIPTEELLLMKRYMTLWINLLSVASIKDFLSRLSFQLMGTTPPSGTDTLK